MPTVKTDDGRTLVFPDGMSKDDMAEALSKLPTSGGIASTSAAHLKANAVRAPDGTMQPAPMGADIQATKTPQADESMMPLRESHPRFAKFVDDGESMNPRNIAIGQSKSILGTGYHVGRMLGLVSENKDFEDALKSENAGQTVGRVATDAAQ